jgi:hypothetical protein
MIGSMAKAWAAVLLPATLLVAGCGLDTMNRSEDFNPSAVMEADSDIARTYAEALVLVPDAATGKLVEGKIGDQRVIRALKGRRLPLVIYLHGCTGIGNTEALQTIASSGFVVIAPNSFARRFRPLQCRPSRQSGGQNIFVYDFRLTEVSYAVHRLRDVPWVDWTKAFLLGVSEGGVAAALYRGNEFAGRVITQWTCQGHPFIRGIASGGGEPVLAIVRKSDPWYGHDDGIDQSGHCGDAFAGRPNSFSYVLEGEGGHDVMGNPRALEAIIDFFSRTGSPAT